MNVRERMMIALETSMSLATVAKWDKGKKMYESTSVSIERAAKKLGLLEKREVDQKKSEVRS